LVTAGAVGTTALASKPKDHLPAVVLVHGGFVDGSGWQKVYKLLAHDGYQVTIVQNPTVSLADDVAVTKRAIDAQSGSVILVGHSYGGAVISEAGNDPKVASLVYIAAFAPDKGESVQTLIANPVPGAEPPPILPPQDGFLFLDREKFRAAFAADVKEDQAAFMGASQVPWACRLWGGRSPCRMAREAELLPGNEERQDDPAPGTASDGSARRRHGRRDRFQPCRHDLEAGRRGLNHREGRSGNGQVGLR